MSTSKTVRAELVEAHAPFTSLGARNTPFDKLRANGCGLIVLLLGGCGSAAELQPAPGRSLPVAPVGARATPTPDQLLTATTQQRPERSAELLRRSEERQGDEFDLPPE